MMSERNTTKLAEHLAACERGELPEVDWTSEPWAAAYPCLLWLGYAPELPEPPVCSEPLGEDDALLLATHMVRRWRLPDGRWAFSSWIIETAAAAVSESVGSVPEPLIRALWAPAGETELTQQFYNFCRYLNGTMFGIYRGREGWDLRWMKRADTDAQRCLRWWVIAVNPAAYTMDEVDAWKAELQVYPYQF